SHHPSAPRESQDPGGVIGFPGGHLDEHVAGPRGEASPRPTARSARPPRAGLRAELSEEREEKDMPTYPTPDPVTLVVRIPTGRIEITTEDTKETTVDVRRIGGRGPAGPDDVVVDFRPSQRSGGQLMVVAERGHKSWFGKDATYHVTVRTPHGADVQGVSGSADFRGVGRFGSIEVRSASGDVWFDDVAGRANVKS